MGAFSLLMTDVGNATAGQVVLGYIKKKKKASQQASFHHGSVPLSAPPQLPLVMGCGWDLSTK